jgi:hypothetical protein
MVKNMRVAFFALSAVIAGCGSSGSGSAVSQPAFCKTGTEVVLVMPIPGTTVSYRLKTMKIASSSGIAFANTALLAESTTGKSSGPFPLLGPVPPPQQRRPDRLSAPLASPTPSPTPTPAPTPTPKPTAPVPFPSPVYYAAHGFSLVPGQTYLLQVVRTDANCRPNTIRNAQFNTTPK